MILHTKHTEWRQNDFNVHAYSQEERIASLEDALQKVLALLADKPSSQ